MGRSQRDPEAEAHALLGHEARVGAQIELALERFEAHSHPIELNVLDVQHPELRRHEQPSAGGRERNAALPPVPRRRSVVVRGAAAEDGRRRPRGPAPEALERCDGPREAPHDSSHERQRGSRDDGGWHSIG